MLRDIAVHLFFFLNSPLSMQQHLVIRAYSSRIHKWDFNKILKTESPHSTCWMKKKNHMLPRLHNRKRLSRRGSHNCTLMSLHWGFEYFNRCWVFLQMLLLCKEDGNYGLVGQMDMGKVLSQVKCWFLEDNEINNENWISLKLTWLSWSNWLFLNSLQSV